MAHTKKLIGSIIQQNINTNSKGAHKPANTIIHTSILLKTFIAYQMCMCRSHLNKEIRQNFLDAHCISKLPTTKEY